MKKILAYTSVAAIATAVFLSVAGFFGDKKTPTTKNNDLWVELEKADADQLRLPIQSYAPIVKRVEGAVLVVYNLQRPPERSQSPFGFGDPFDDPFFRFFRPQQPQNPGQGKGKKQPPPEVGKPQKVGSGSGFIIHPEGYALTNYHVIENATNIKIKIGKDQKEYDAEVIGAEPSYDVALIKIKSARKDWPVIPLGNSDQMQVGDPVLAIGNPFGLEHSVTHGILSARSRYDAEASQLGDIRIYDFVQTDAGVNPGNSGGPLLNVAGEAIGINTAIIRGGNAIAFTIPINQVKQILPPLKKNGKAPRSYIGVEVAPLTEDVAKSLGLTGATGALVRRVEPDSPAAKAGLQPGDVITEFAGEPVNDTVQLTVRASLSMAGKAITVKIVRDKKVQTLTVTPATKPGESLTKKDGETTLKGQTFSLESLGFSAVTLDDTARKQLGLNSNIEGARVEDVDPTSAAAGAGISKNDVIVKINGEAIKTAKQLTDVIAKLPKDSIIHVLAVTAKGYAYFTTLAKP